MPGQYTVEPSEGPSVEIEMSNEEDNNKYYCHKISSMTKFPVFVVCLLGNSSEQYIYM